MNNKALPILNELSALLHTSYTGGRAKAQSLLEQLMNLCTPEGVEVRGTATYVECDDTAGDEMRFQIRESPGEQTFLWLEADTGVYLAEDKVRYMGQAFLRIADSLKKLNENK